MKRPTGGFSMSAAIADRNARQRFLRNKEAAVKAEVDKRVRIIDEDGITCVVRTIQFANDIIRGLKDKYQGDRKVRWNSLEDQVIFARVKKAS